jgi:hypothetical protein
MVHVKTTIIRSETRASASSVLKGSDRKTVSQGKMKAKHDRIIISSRSLAVRGSSDEITAGQDLKEVSHAGMSVSRGRTDLQEIIPKDSLVRKELSSVRQGKISREITGIIMTGVRDRITKAETIITKARTARNNETADHCL